MATKQKSKPKKSGKKSVHQASGNGSILAHQLFKQYRGPAVFDFACRPGTKRIMISAQGRAKIGVRENDYMLLSHVNGKLFAAAKPRGVFGGFQLSVTPNASGVMNITSNSFSELPEGLFEISDEIQERVTTEGEKDVVITWHELKQTDK